MSAQRAIASLSAMQRAYYKWWSPHMRRDMELLVLGHSGAKVLVFPTRGGRFYEYENLGIAAALGSKLTDGHLQLFCVDGVDRETFYAHGKSPRARAERHYLYEAYVLHEVLPFMDDLNPHPCRIVHGCSLGAFHAASLAFRYPHLFRKLAAFSGRYDLTLSVDAFRDLFDGYFDESIYFLQPSHFLPRLDCPRLLRHTRQMDIVIAIGESDPFIDNNRHLSSTLHAKGVPHRMHLWPDRAHNAHAWRPMAAHLL